MAEITIGLGTYFDRLRRAQVELQQQGIDALLVGPSSDLFYLIGYDAHLSERLNLLLLPKQGDASYVVPVLEAPRVADRAELIDVHSWEETQAPTEIVASIIGDGHGKKLAVSDQLWSIFLLRLQDALPGASWVPATPVIRPLRMVKDGQEIELMKEVSRRTDDAWEEFIAKERLTGLTERQAMDRLRALMVERGLEGQGGICASGPNTASPHHGTSDRVIQAGEAVLFDWGGQLGGYQSDITRTVHIGEPSDEFRKVYDIVLQANEATLAAVRPGVPCEQLDDAARNLISNAGYGEAFIHRVGHGLGLDGHEEPYLVSGNTTPLVPGMIFSDEPGIYLAGRFGVRIEDAVLCNEWGGERLNDATRELIVME